MFQGLQQELAVSLQFQDFELRRDTESVRERASTHAAYVMHLSARDLVIVHRIDNSKWRFLRGDVGPQAFRALVGKVMAAAP